MSSRVLFTKSRKRPQLPRVSSRIFLHTKNEPCQQQKNPNKISRRQEKSPPWQAAYQATTYEDKQRQTNLINVCKRTHRVFLLRTSFPQLQMSCQNCLTSPLIDRVWQSKVIVSTTQELPVFTVNLCYFSPRQKAAHDSSSQTQ